MTDAARWKATVYVGGLAPIVTVATLHDAFLPFGDIADVSLPKNENPNSNTTEPHRGFAYVEFEDADDAKEAMDNMDQSEFFGRVIKVTAAKAPKSADEGLGSKTAIWEQVCLPQELYLLQKPIETNGLRYDRRAGLQKMLSAKKIGSQPNKRRRQGILGQRIPCKVLRALTWLGLDRRRQRCGHEMIPNQHNSTWTAFGRMGRLDKFRSIVIQKAANFKAGQPCNPSFFFFCGSRGARRLLAW